MTDQEFPQPEPDDADEVVLALKTAGSLWTSGEKLEAIRWLRKAQESADGAGNDMRSLTLARAAAELTEAAEKTDALKADETEQSASEPAATEDSRPQLTKPPMPPPNPKTRLESPRAKASNGRSSAAVVAVAREGNGQPESGGVVASEPGPILTQTLRVGIKRSVRDDELLVARVLEDGEVPVGYQEALVVLTDPSQDLLDKLS
jgi:hypothetical protein